MNKNYMSLFEHSNNRSTTFYVRNLYSNPKRTSIECTHDESLFYKDLILSSSIKVEKKIKWQMPYPERVPYSLSYLRKLKHSNTSLTYIKKMLIFQKYGLNATTTSRPKTFI